MKKIVHIVALLVLFAFKANAQCNNFKTVVSGSNANHTLGIKNDGTLWAWGRNNKGQLGDGTTTNKLTPTQVGTATNWVSVAAGEEHSLGIKSDGTLWAWGDNTSGQLGNGTTTSSLVPIQIGIATNWSVISAGSNHSAAITTDKKLWTWGNNDIAQLGDGTNITRLSPNQIGTSLNWVTVSAGYYYNLAITTGRTLFSWGQNIFGQLGNGTNTVAYTPTQVGNMALWKSVSACENHSLGIWEDGRAWSWGANYNGQLGDGTTTNRNTPAQIGVGSVWANLIGGGSFSMGNTIDNELWAWGINSYGQLGLGSSTTQVLPTRIGLGTNWINASVGYSHSTAITRDGSFWAWGANYYGHLGNGTTNDKNIPTQIGSTPTYTGLTSSSSTQTLQQGHYLLFNAGCSLIAAVNNSREWVNPIKGSITAKVWVDGAANAKYVKRHYEIMPLTNPSTTTARVTLYFTQQEFNDFNAANAVKLPTGPNDVDGIANLLIEKRDGQSSDGSGNIYTYSGTSTNVTYGQGGFNNVFWNAAKSWWEVSFNVTGFGGFWIKTQSGPLVGPCKTFKTIVSGTTGDHKLGIKEDGTLWAWGYNGNWQINNGPIVSSIPTQIGTATNWIAVAAGGQHSLALKSDGTLWAWGRNDNGEIGDGNTYNTVDAPKQVGIGIAWTKIFAGEAQSFAIAANGALYGWGKNELGQLGLGNVTPKILTPTIIIPASTNNVVHVSSGEFHTLVIKSNGTLWAWGLNNNGQLGNGTSINRLAPIQIGTATNWAGIAVGGIHSLAIKLDGTLWAWGDNGYGQLGNGTNTNSNIPIQVGTATNWVNVSAGYNHSLATKSDGTAWAWGINDYGQTGLGQWASGLESPQQIGTATNWVTTGSGYSNSFGIASDGTYWAWGDNGYGQSGNNNTNASLLYSPVQITSAPNVTALALSGSIITFNSGQYNMVQNGSCTFSVAINNSKASLNPIVGSTTAKVWLDATQNMQFVKRHFEITPTNNASTSKGRVSLYFTQQEFDDFNAVNTIKLPASPNDATGKANLLIEKIGGVSSNGSGHYSTYTGAKTTINPADVDIKWNSTYGFWEVTFDVEGFSGFWAKTQTAVLPLQWLNVSGKLNANKQATINWQVQENNVAKYEIEKSSDGRTFTRIGFINSKGDGTNNYTFIESTLLNGVNYYRIKQINIDGKHTYSSIIKLNNSNSSQISIYPNPAKDVVTINGAKMGSNLILTDLNGKLLLKMVVTQNSFTIDIRKYASGVYVVKTDEGVIQKLFKE